MSAAPTKKELGMCLGIQCRVGVEPGQERCADCAREWAKRSAPCVGCGTDFTRKSDQPKAKFCSKACFRRWKSENMTGKKRGPARFRPPGASSAKLHEDACRCRPCLGSRFQPHEERAAFVARVAEEMGFPVSPLAGVPIKPLTPAQFAAKWEKINGAKRTRRGQVLWR